MKQELFVEEYGTFLGYSNGAIVVRSQQEVREKRRIAEISHIILQGDGVSISNAALIACAAKDTPVFIFDHTSRPQAVMHSPQLHKDYQLQERQRIFLSSVRATRLVTQLLHTKEAQQRAVLQYHWRSLRRTHEALSAADLPRSEHEFDCAHFHVRLAEARDALFLKEARSGRVYWRAMRGIAPLSLQFRGRIKKRARDPLNQLLNYGYALLSGTVLRQILFAGLDPGIGLLHHRQGAAYPLVYDFMEPFRPLVDHAVLAFVHRQHQKLQNRHGELRRSVLRRFYAHYARTMARPEPWSRRRKSLEALVKEIVGGFRKPLAPTRAPEGHGLRPWGST